MVEEGSRSERQWERGDWRMEYVRCMMKSALGLLEARRRVLRQLI